MAECTGLENQRRVKPTQGSNPCLSVSDKDSHQIDVSPFFVGDKRAVDISPNLSSLVAGLMMMNRWPDDS